MPTSEAPASGKDRFRNFRDLIRAEGFSLSCQAQTNNLEIWSITGPKGYTRIAVILGDDGFDLFFASESIAMKDDLEVIKQRIG